MYKEFGETLTKRLEERGWSRETIDKEWKNIKLIVTGHSQGGIVAFKLYQKYKHELNIKGLQLVNTPLMGLAFLNLSLEKILEEKDILSMTESLLSFPIEDLLKVAETACQNKWGQVLLSELINKKDSNQKSSQFQKLLQEGCTKKLVDLLNQEYKRLIDIQSYAKEIWECIRVGEVTCSSGSQSNNDSKTPIHLVHSSIDQSTLEQLMGILFNFIKPIIIKPIKVINKMDKKVNLALLIQ